MAFPNGTTLLYFPISANAGASQWGSDVRKLLSADEVTSDSNTIFNLGTGGTVTRTADPYSTSTADLTQADYGWAVTPSDMGSTAGAKRVIPAGDHVVHFQATISVAFTTEARGWTLYVYRVGPAAGRTRTLLGSVSGTFPLATGDTTVTLALGELVFENDETIQYSFEATAGGLAVLGRVVNMSFGAGISSITTPPWDTLAVGVGSASGGAVAAGVLAAIGALLGASAGLASVSGTMAGIAHATGAAAGAATASGAMAAVGGMVGSSAGLASASGTFAAVGGMVGDSDGVGAANGAGAIVLPTLGASNGVATVAGTLAAVGEMVGSSAGVATVSGSMGAVAEAVGAAAGVATANGSLAAVLGTVGSSVVGAGGGETVYVGYSRGRVVN